MSQDLILIYDSGFIAFYFITALLRCNSYSMLLFEFLFPFVSYKKKSMWYLYSKLTFEKNMVNRNPWVYNIEWSKIVCRKKEIEYIQSF